MRLKTLILFSLLLLAWRARAYAQDGADDPPGPVILTEEQDSYPLGLYMEILEDPSGELTIEDVTSPAYAEQFRVSEVEVPNYGFTDSVYWVRLPLRNESEITTRWLLEIVFANMQFVDLFVPLDDGDDFAERQTGSLRPAASRDIQNPHVVFDLQIPSESEQTFYLRFQNGGSMTLDLVLWEPFAFVDHAQAEHLRYGIFFGVMLAMLAYNLFLLFSLREKSYLYLALFITNFLIFISSYLGYLEVYIVPDLYYLKNSYMAFSFALISVLAILFSDNFLRQKSYLPRIHKTNIVILGIWSILILLIPFFSYFFAATVMVPLALPSMAIVLIGGIVSWQNGNRAARFFLFAWGGFLVTISLIFLVRLAIIPATGIYEYAYLFGIMWMAVSWSIALADRINLLKEESDEASHGLQRSRNRLAQILEGLPLGVVVYGKDFKPTFSNQRVTEILGNPGQGIMPDISVGRTLSQAMEYYTFRIAGSSKMYPLEKMPVLQALQGRGGSADDLEADLVDRRVPLEIWASPVLDQDGNVESAVVAFQDITSRRQAEEALRTSEKKFRAVVENVFDGVAFLDRDRRILYVSPSYERLNGLSADKMLGQSGVQTIHPDDRSHVAATFQKLLEQPGGRIHQEYRIRHQDSSWIWVETRAMNLLDDPHIRAVVLNSRDITQRKQQQLELDEYHQHLEQLVQERTEELALINERLSAEITERVMLEDLLHKRIAWMSAFSLARQKLRGTADLQGTYEELSATIKRLLDAGSVFLICWDCQDEAGEFMCQPCHDSPTLDAQAIRKTLAKDSALRREIEGGNERIFGVDEAASLPASLQACFAGDDIQSLLLTPMGADGVVNGVLVTAIPQQAQNLALAQTELVSKMAYDLASLNEYAIFLVNARALVAAEERNRLARDLHDSVTQVLFSASLVAEVLPNVWRRDPERAMESLGELRRLTRGALAEMRTMLLELRPTAVAKTPLPELLGQLTEASTTRSDLPFRLAIEKTPPLPADVHASFYRIAQEALNNVAKHAQASEVIISLRAQPLMPEQAGEQKVEVMLLVQDNGLGFAPENEQLEHLGLDIMRERAAGIQADLAIDSRIGEGTCVSVVWCGNVEEKS